MGVNGVSHHVVPDDLAGVSAVLQWLSYTPALVGQVPPVLVSADPIARSIDYAPLPGETALSAQARLVLVPFVVLATKP